MKSIKRGRGPSFMNGVSLIGVAVFGVFWTIMAAGIGAPAPLVMGGLVFIGIAVVNAVYNFRNAAGKQRYSEYDITDGHEEPDPLNERFGGAAGQPEYGAEPEGEAFAFCPYCGKKLDEGDNFCGKCGRRIGKG